MSVTMLSVVIPCFNEAATLETLVERVLAADRLGLGIEVILVDDGSTDGSTAIAEQLAARHSALSLLRHERNRGKGAALKTGFAATTGDIVLVQDADLEYDPGEYPRLLKPILDGYADVVYGSRFRGGEPVRALFFWHALGNRLLTLLSNLTTDFNLTDMETCYKVFRRDVIARIEIKEARFGFEPEITARISRLEDQPRLYEVAISYRGRTYREGKKIGWRDGVWAMWCIFRYGLFN
jgi:glycosyltransferase involved in cell wall biosynthesis